MVKKLKPKTKKNLTVLSCGYCCYIMFHIKTLIWYVFTLTLITFNFGYVFWFYVIVCLRLLIRLYRKFKPLADKQVNRPYNELFKDTVLYLVRDKDNIKVRLSLYAYLWLQYISFCCCCCLPAYVIQHNSKILTIDIYTAI